MAVSGNTTGTQGGVQPLFGLAPSAGIASVNTGIRQGTSTSPQQLAQLQGIYAGMGLGPGAQQTPAASLAGQGAPAMKAGNDTYNTLTQQQGAVKGNQFANTVNEQEAKLGGQQAQAESQAE